jgi:hypothetical protein
MALSDKYGKEIMEGLKKRKIESGDKGKVFLVLS